jgi:hypothetical protein
MRLLSQNAPQYFNCKQAGVNSTEVRKPPCFIRDFRRHLASQKENQLRENGFLFLHFHDHTGDIGLRKINLQIDGFATACFYTAIVFYERHEFLLI